MTNESNPYQAPDSVVADPAKIVATELASKGRRFGTFFIDYIGCTFCGGFVGGVIGVTFGESGAAAMQGFGGIFFGIVVMMAYYVFFEGLWSRTPGKFLCGTIVVTVDGEKPGIGQIVKRTACRLIPFEVFSFLGEMGWHDSISDTRVILAR